MSYTSLRDWLIKISASCKILPFFPTIAYLEFLSAVIQICWFAEIFHSLLAGKKHIVKIDNTNCISWFKKNKMKFRPYNYLFKLLCSIELRLGCRFKTVFIKSSVNRIADSLTRENADKPSLKIAGKTVLIQKIPPLKVLKLIASALTDQDALLDHLRFGSLFEVFCLFSFSSRLEKIHR